MAQRSRGVIFVRGRSEQCSTGNRLSLSSKFLRPTLQDRIARAEDLVIAAALLALTLPLFVLLSWQSSSTVPAPCFIGSFASVLMVGGFLCSIPAIMELTAHAD